MGPAKPRISAHLMVIVPKASAVTTVSVLRHSNVPLWNNVPLTSNVSKVSASSFPNAEKIETVAMNDFVSKRVVSSWAVRTTVIVMLENPALSLFARRSPASETPSVRFLWVASKIPAEPSIAEQISAAAREDKSAIAIVVWMKTAVSVMLIVKTDNVAKMSNAPIS